TTSSRSKRDQNKNYLENGYCVNEQERFAKKQKGKPAAIFSETYVCQQASKCGCTAKINAVVCKDDTDLNLIRVTYQWKHTGHNPTSRDEVISGPSQRYVAEFIKEQVENNMTWYNIKAMLRLDRATLANLIDCEDNNIPIALIIQCHQVYYQMKKVLQRRARLDTDFVSSINKWLL
ncbi:hypothetical protein, partial, partial [Parasitella parasitica]